MDGIPARVVESGPVDDDGDDDDEDERVAGWGAHAGGPRNSVDVIGAMGLVRRGREFVREGRGLEMGRGDEDMELGLGWVPPSHWS